MLVSECMELVSFILNDVDHVTYTEPVLVNACNMSVRSVCSVRPDASTAMGQVILVDGVMQELPAGGLRLLDYGYRIDPDGQRMPLNMVSRHDLDRLEPGWAAQPGGVVRELAYDERIPRLFWCVPPAVSGSVVEVLYSTLPEPVVSLDDPFPLSDKYSPVIAEYILYLIFSRDSESQAHQGKASAHLQACYQLLGMKMQSDAKVSPIKAEG